LGAGETLIANSVKAGTAMVVKAKRMISISMVVLRFSRRCAGLDAECARDAANFDLVSV
jgi:hypothetical protein